MADPSFGKYTLIAELGHGGMADVFLGVSRGPAGFSKLLVIKRLRENLIDDPEFVAMLVDEARLAARLNHPNVVQTYEVGQEGRQYFISMEYLEGQPLHRIVQRADRRKKMGRDLHLTIVSEALSGLHYAHELADYDGKPLCVVHRDISPHNIFVTYDGVVKVVDFGIAKAVGRQAETRTGIIKGKVNYMAPEQALGQDIDRRADVFACGVLLWEAATGSRLWKGMNDLAIVQSLLAGELKRPREAAPDVPVSLENVIMKALAMNPDERFSTALELQAALDEYFDKQGKRALPRQIGGFVTELFDDKRVEIRALIEKQLAALSQHGDAASLIKITEPPSSLSGGTPSGQLPLTFGTPPSGRSEPGASAGADGGPDDTKASNLVSTPRGQRSRPTNWIPYAALGAGVLAAVAWFARPRASASETTPRATASAVQASAPAAPKTIKLLLRASPGSAHFRIDGGGPLENPYAGEFPIDKKEHEIRVEADGYEPVTTKVSFSEDVRFDTQLAPLPATTETASTAKHHAVAAPPPPPPQKGGRHARPIDTGNPW
ncbi:MAG TPA: protein kinase [Minicystis sp.]|nr:protein kinase [Minicystis sp.]